TNPANNLYTVALPALKEGNNRGAVEPTGQLPYATAYRVILCCDLKMIAESTAITDLSAPLDKKFAGKLPQWVQPGKATWDWLSYVSTGDAERQKKYIDAAHEFGWQYTLVDANWNKWNNGNAEPLLRELVDYAGKKRIGLWLWYNSGGPSNTITEEPRDLMHERSKRRTEFERLRKIGIKGVKIDFWQSDKQAMVQQYIETLEDAADFQLMVNFHGSTTPKGWQRRFPNLMTMEAVKGAEWYQFPVFRGPNAHDNVYYALTRNVIGPMDYTPLVFAQALDQQKISYAHSLALSVVFESGVQHFADNADDAAKGYRKLFANFPFAREFLRNVPVTWDHTLLLEGNPETHVVFAREKQGVWYIAGISAVSTELQIRQPFTFGTYGNYRAEWITEGETTDSLRYVETELHTGGRQYIDVKVKARGGFVLKLTPK
ncbi:MAG TPA: glycoside hydrolase family 97 catalytic domain-containing protein, partial [Turneriella sp.]|nr:glycoside hydrolase family 97 catalytic domain-containing protein [Turneriella sp.]